MSSGGRDRGSLRRLVDAGAGVSAAGAAAFAWGALVERTLYTVREAHVPILPPTASPLRVLHISDVHMAPWQRDKQEWVRALADLEPDVIVNTGDNIGHERGLEGIQYAFDAFRGIPGVFVHGSNDYFAPTFRNPVKYFTGPSRAEKPEPKLDVSQMDAFFESLGWHSVDNAAVMLRLRGTSVEFFGVDDPHIRRDRLEQLPGAIDAMREDAAGDEQTGARVSIGVAHAPYQRILNSFVAMGAQLMLAGHTHGGQVCIPLVGAIVTNCDIPRDQVKGLSTWHNAGRTAFLNVSAGLGTSIYAPYRFACRPEVSLITLTPGDA